MKNQTNGIDIIVICALIIIIEVIAKSRALILGSTIGLLFIYQRTTRRKISIMRSAMFILSLAIFLSVCFKQDSSMGRILIYKIGWNIFENHLNKGIGLGNFKVVYKDYQIDYFKNHPYSIKDLLVADNTQFAFNDYFQFIIETGWVGLTSFVLLSAILYSMVSQRNENVNRKMGKMELLASFVLTTILVAAAFTHVFESGVATFEQTVS